MARMEFKVFCSSRCVIRNEDKSSVMLSTRLDSTMASPANPAKRSKASAVIRMERPSAGAGLIGSAGATGAGAASATRSSIASPCTSGRSSGAAAGGCGASDGSALPMPNSPSLTELSCARSSLTSASCSSSAAPPSEKALMKSVISSSTSTAAGASSSSPRWAATKMSSAMWVNLTIGSMPMIRAAPFIECAARMSCSRTGAGSDADSTATRPSDS